MSIMTEKQIPYRRYAHGIMFHHFHGEGHEPAQGSMDAVTFERFLDSLSAFNILSPQEFAARAYAGSLQENDICLTFDDALRCQYDVALPVLECRGMRAFFFLTSCVLEGAMLKLEIYRYVRTCCFSTVDAFYAAFRSATEHSRHAQLCAKALTTFRPQTYLQQFSFYSDADRTFRYLRDKVLGPEQYEEVMDGIVTGLERARTLDLSALKAMLWMSPNMVRDLRGRGHTIGLHSHTHPTQMNTLPVDIQRYEYTENTRVLSGLLGEKITCMSHPCNSWNEETLNVLGDLGITLGFCATMEEHPGLLRLPRQDHANILATLR